MKQYAVERKSHCHVCGKRLSEKQQSGGVHWKPCNVDDKGIYCATCAAPKKKGKTARSFFI